MSDTTSEPGLSRASDKGKAPETHNAFGAPSSMSSRLLAAYEAGRSERSEQYFEVPSSHFLARPSGAGSASRSTPSFAAPSTASGIHRTQQRSESDNRSAASSFVTVHEAPLSALTPTYERILRSDERKSLTSFSSDDHRDDGLSSVSLGAQSAAAGGLDGLAGPANFFGGQRPHMPDTSTLAAADFDIDVRSGFLPPEEPVSRLQGIEEELWESALDRARQLPLHFGGGGVGISADARRQARQWRRDIRQMLVLHPSPQLTADIRFARRAHLVLSFLAHYYMHSQPQETKGREVLRKRMQHIVLSSPDEQDQWDEAMGKYSGLVPASIAVPWVAISRMIDLPPILTYATTVLWNWRLRDHQRGFTDDNLEIATTFSGTSSEVHFYLISLLIEKRGVEALTLMRRSLDEAFVADRLALRRIRRYIRKLATVLGDLQRLLHDIRVGCDPKTFFWGIRPWFNGCDSYVDKETGQKGWVYEGVEEFGGQRMLFLGPSAGQSSLIHALDVFLGVDHAGHATTASQQENATFMERMQTYMPGPHRNFLTHLRNISFNDDDTEEDDAAVYQDAHSEGVVADAEEDMDVDMDDVSSSSSAGVDHSVPRETNPLRSLMVIHEGLAVDDSREGVARRVAVERLREAYNDTLTALKHMRDEHMRIATLYIISQMRTAPPTEYAPLNEALTMTVGSEAGTAEAQEEQSTTSPAQKGAKGTGGTDLVSFLKDCRKNTIDALVNPRRP